MRRNTLRGGIVAVLGVGLAAAGWGCASQPDARYVYQDGQFGVIGIPQNTKFGRKDYLSQAQELMSRHFPDGYEIVRAEEVIEGERSLNAGRKTELATEPSVKAFDQMIKLGKLAETKSVETKDSVPILESRIIYKRKRPGEPQGANGFAALPSTVPPLYIDPNEMTRCKSTRLIAEAKKDTDGEKKGDSAIQRAAHKPKDDECK
jgi:hypothetical protein